MDSATLQSPSQMSFISNDSLKFGLYVKTQEIKQIVASLEHVMLMPKKQRATWVEEHETMINQLLDDFMQDASLALDGLHLDSEALKLSMDFVTTLRDAMNTLQGILYERSNLMS